MNGYDAMKRMLSISDELTILSHEFSVTSKPSVRDTIEKKINALENEFFVLKHGMERVKLPVLPVS